MELIVKEMTLPQALEFNYEDLKSELAIKLNDYKTIVYTADSIKNAKADRSALNKLKKALNDERIRLEKEYMQPFNDFKAKVNELCRMIDEASGAVDKQIKEFEEAEKSKKRDEIVAIFDANMTDLPWLSPGMIWNEKWLNASFKLAQVEGDIKNWHTLIVDEIEVLGRLKEYSFEATEFYKKTLNLSEAIKYADGLVEMAEAKAKMEAQMAAEQPGPQENEQMEIPTQNFMPAPENPGNDSLELFEIGFRVRGTADQLQKLSHFMKASGIHFERI